MIFVEMFAALVVGHLIFDYPLQGDFLARGKNVSAPLPGVPWLTILASHAAIQGGSVWAISTAFLWLAGVDLRTAVRAGLWLGMAETVAHGVIDHLKCSGVLGQGERAFNIDQGLHIACKAVWAIVAASAL